MTTRIILLILVALCTSAAAFGQVVTPACGPRGDILDCYQIGYAPNLPVGDSIFNFTNDGSSSTDPGLPFAQNGEICANIYVYSPDEQLVSCCSCNVTPNGLNSVSVKNDLLTNTLTPIVPTSVVVKILVTRGGSDCVSTSAATAGDATHPFAPGLAAWNTKTHPAPNTPGATPGTFGVVETDLISNTLVPAERIRMTQLCAFIRANGSGYGICKSCRIGGLGASAK